MKSLLHLTIVLFFTLALQAQVGIGNTSPNGALDITATDNGLLIPRVALTSTTTLPAGFLTPTTSELVYNTATAGDVTPGFYYLSGPTGLPWVRLETGADGTSWEIDGNDNVTNANFIGTVTGTNVDVAFRRNGIASGKIGATSTSFGVGALTNGAASNSTAIGNNALSVSTGNNNVAIGQNALLSSVTSAQWNTAIGNRALTGINNSAAQGNTAVGFETMTGTGNISNTTAIGYHALFQNRVNGATAIGYNALQGQIAAATGNTGVGFTVLNNNTSGDNNTALGHAAGFGVARSNNTLIGHRAGEFTSGDNNTAVGANTLPANSQTDNNVAIGANALAANIADNITAVGFNALTANSSGTNNTAVGYNALDANVLASNSTALGSNALTLSTGANNTALGSNAGNTITTGANNITIGSNAQVPTITGDNQLNIGNWIYGNSGNIGIGAPTPNGALEITSANNGLLIPRVALTSLTDLTVVTPTASELVYNTTFATPSNDVSPGFYYLEADTGPWKRLGEGASTPPPPPPPPSATGAWLIDGNADIVEGTNFIGTTNGVDVVFRREDDEAGRIGTTLTTFGLGAGIANTGLDNTYIGHNAGNTISAGAARNNVAVGSQSLEGGPGSSLAQTVAIGAQALQNPSNSTSNNIAIGYRAARDTNGSNNVIIGAEANAAVTPVPPYPAEAASLTPNETVVIGAQARAFGNNSVAIGYRSKAVANNEIRLGNSQTQTVITAGVMSAFSFLATGTGTPYADYVFEDYFDGISKINADYKFNSLESAEAFVIKNGHLPGVKSYAEVMENGFKLDITDATITNLEKLEEQFIYITQLNKKIKTQDIIIQTQDEKIKALESRLERIEKLLNN